jgi:hypothetical protein
MALTVMSELVPSSRPQPRAVDEIAIASRVVAALGGRYSTEMGIDVDQGDDEIERWFLAATLFGTRISARVAERTFRVFADHGLSRVALASEFTWDALVALLDEGGYTRYDFRTATRLHVLADVVRAEYEGRAARLGVMFRTYSELREALDELPGWGPVTIELFLRELRGVWPGAEPPTAPRAVQAALHLGLWRENGTETSLACVRRLATESGLDVRDLESGLVRLSLAHRGGMEHCSGNASCVALADDRRPRDQR